MSPLEKFDPQLVQDDLRQHAMRWGRTWTEVDLGALDRNFSRLAGYVPPQGKIIVSAKKDAYGHGVLAVAGRLESHLTFGALGVATVEEILFLREHGYRGEMIIFCTLWGEALEAAIGAGAILTLTSLEEASEASAVAERLGTPARMHLKIDTGMGRLGQFAENLKPEMAALRALPHVQIEGLYTHLPNAWANHEQGRGQWAALKQFAREAGLEKATLHLGGSDALGLGLEHEAGMWLRLGIAVYGDHAANHALEPVMTFKTRVIYRRRVPAGTPISYCGTHVTQRETELAVLGAGYGNGYPRNLSNTGAHVLLRGERCAVLGRICMDQMIVDVTGVPAAAVGDEAVLFGLQRWEGQVLHNRAAELAACAGTISYELFCLAGRINPRKYV